MALQEEDHWTFIEMLCFAAGGMVIVFALLSMASAFMGAP